MVGALPNKAVIAPSWQTNTISTSTIIPPQATRDANTPDLGYHYDPIDYLSSFQLTNATLILTNGVVLGYYTTNGILAQNNGVVLSQGTPTQMNRLTYYNLVQEQPVNLSGLTN